jgi:hypothetical protein
MGETNRVNKRTIELSTPTVIYRIELRALYVDSDVIVLLMTIPGQQYPGVLVLWTSVDVDDKSALDCHFLVNPADRGLSRMIIIMMGLIKLFMIQC